MGRRNANCLRLRATYSSLPTTPSTHLYENMGIIGLLNRRKNLTLLRIRSQKRYYGSRKTLIAQRFVPKARYAYSRSCSRTATHFVSLCFWLKHAALLKMILIGLLSRSSFLSPQKKVANLKCSTLLKHKRKHKQLKMS